MPTDYAALAAKARQQASAPAGRVSEVTTLAPAAEARFQAWAQQNKIGDVDAPESKYDYRGYFQDVVSKGGNETKQYPDGLHFTDTYKQHGHPTFSEESKYSKGPGDGGTWGGPDGETYQPAKPAAVDYAALANAARTGPPPASAPADTIGSRMRSSLGQVADVGLGALKGAGQTATNLGKMVHKIPGVSAGVDALYGTPGISQAGMQAADAALTPTTTEQSLGKGAEQVGEFFVPGLAATKVGRLGRAVTDASLALTQSGSPVQAGVTGALSAALPGAGAVKAGAGMLETSARKSMAQALGANKEWAKSEAAKLAPEMLTRGLGGSRGAMLETAKATAKRVGTELNEAYRLAAAAGETVPASIVHGNLQLSADALKVADAHGVLKVIPGTEAVVQKLDDLGAFVVSLGDDIPVDKAAKIKRTWDHITSKAGLFGPKATASATDNSTAFATREAAGSFRELLNTNPDIAALNAESAFWTGLKNVLKETEKRTQSQRGGLIAAGGGGTGAIVGAMSGNGAGDRTQKALLGAAAGAALTRGIRSPWWQSKAAGPAKHLLAEALATGDAGRIAGAVNRIVTASAGAAKFGGPVPVMP